MWSVITYSIAGALTIPFVLTWMVYKVNRIRNKSRLYAFHKSVKWTTVLYVLSVMALCKIIFNHYFIGYIIAFHLLLLAVCVIFQRVNYTEVVLGKAWKIVWRFSFLFFLTGYTFLILYGILQRMLLI